MQQARIFRWTTAVLVAAATTIVAPISDAVEAQTTAFPQMYLPLVLQDTAWSTVPGTFVASVAVQAAQQLGPTGTTFTVEYRRPDGTVAYTTPDLSLSAGGRLDHLPAAAALPPGRYTAVVRSPARVVAQVNLLGQDPAMGASYRGVWADETGGCGFPVIYKSYHGYTSVIAVQNVEDLPTRAIVTYRDAAGATVGTEEQNLPAHGAAEFSQAVASLPDGFVGSASVVADRRSACAVLVYNPAGELVGVSRGTAFHDLVSLPVVYKNYSADGWVSSILVQNGETAAPIRITFRGAGLPAPVVLTDTLPPFASRQYWQGDAPADLPDGFVGSATVESSYPIAAFVNTRNARGHLGGYVGAVSTPPVPALYAYAGISQQVRFADLYNDYSSLHWTSSLIVMNANFTDPAPVTIAYHARGASSPVRTVTETLAPHESRLHYLPNEGLPAGFTGAAIATSTGGQIVGVANSLAVGQGVGDWLLTTEGETTYPNIPPPG